MKSKISFLLAVFASTLSILASCNQDDQIGYNLLPDADSVQVLIVDTFAIQTTSVRQERIKTDEPAYATLGTLVDPLFGKIEAGFATGIRPRNFYQNLPLDIMPVSASLKLGLRSKTPTNNYTGDTAAVQEFIVYKMLDSLFLRNDYFSDSYPDETFLQEIGRHSFSPFFDSLSNYIEIPLSQQFSSDLLTTLVADTTNTGGLKDPLLGIYVKTSTRDAGGAIYYINLLDTANTKMELNYTSESQVVGAVQMIVSKNDARYNVLTHDYAQASIAGVSGDFVSDTACFIQGGAGLAVDIKLPFLDKFQKENQIIAINRAELLIPARSADESLFDLPAALALRGIDDEGNATSLQEFASTLQYIGTVFDTTYQHYAFDIPFYTQNVVEGSVMNNGLRLSVATPGYDLGRVVLASSVNTQPMKLVITYTRLK